jgi:integrase
VSRSERNKGLSTNSYLRRFHNFAQDLGWLPWPVLPKRQWPAVHYREKRAITRPEQDLIVTREPNPELRAFYWCCWHLGGAQSDVARLKAEDIDWQAKVVSFFRSKKGTAQVIHFGEGLAQVLGGLPTAGPLFPRLAAMDEKRRACLFQTACRRAGVAGVSLPSYRYSWAERAKRAGYPERFAQMALGHTSKAVHRAYAKKAQVTLPPLEEYEYEWNTRWSRWSSPSGGPVETRGIADWGCPFHSTSTHQQRGLPRFSRLVPQSVAVG